MKRVIYVMPSIVRWEKQKWRVAWCKQIGFRFVTCRMLRSRQFFVCNICENRTNSVCVFLSFLSVSHSPAKQKNVFADRRCGSVFHHCIYCDRKLHWNLFITTSSKSICIIKEERTKKMESSAKYVNAVNVHKHIWLNTLKGIYVFVCRVVAFHHFLLLLLFNHKSNQWLMIQFGFFLFFYFFRLRYIKNPKMFQPNWRMW